MTDRVQSVSSLAVAPCAQQLLTCNKWVLLLMSCLAACTSCAAPAPIALQSSGGDAQLIGVATPKFCPRQRRRVGVLQRDCCTATLYRRLTTAGAAGALTSNSVTMASAGRRPQT